MSAVWENWYREAWTESVPAPLDMTDTEILDWIGKNADRVLWDEKDRGKVLCWRVVSDDLRRPVKGATIREAVQQAAAILKEQG